MAELTIIENTQNDFSIGLLYNVEATIDNKLQLSIPNDPSFTRSSIAYKQDGTQVAANAPRFEAGKFAQAVMVEEGTTNLLTANQSSVETDTTGFTVFDSTLTRDTTTAWHGSASLKCVTNNAGAYEGFGVPYSTSTQDTYVGQVRLKGSGTVYVWLRINYTDTSYEQTSSVLVSLTDLWQQVVTPAITTNSAKTVSSIDIFVRTNVQQAITFYADGLQLEAKSYATFWTLGDSTRSPETLTIPTAGVLNPQEGTVECWVYLDGDIVAESPATTHWIFSHATSPSPNALGFRRSMGTSGSNLWEAWSRDGSGNATTVYVTWAPTVGWHFFALRWSASELALFIDGVKMGSATNPYLPSSLSSVAYVGLWATGNYGWINTLLDDFRISSCTRTDAEIAAAYQSGQPLPVDEWTTYKMNFDNNLTVGAGGYRINSYNISSVGIVSASNVMYTASNGVTIESSIDGISWELVTSNRKIPQINKNDNVSNITLYLKEKFITEDISNIPYLSEIIIDFFNPGYCFGNAVFGDNNSYYISDIPTNLITFTSIDFYAGTHSESFCLAKEYTQTEIELLLEATEAHSWDVNTIFLASFDETLEAGTLTNEGVPVVGWRLKRQDEVTLEIVTIKDFNINDYDILITYIDRTPCSNRNYVYYVMPIDENGSEGVPLSVPSGIEFYGWMIIDPDDQNNYVLLYYDLEDTDIQLEEDRTELRTFSQYPLVRYGEGDFHRGTLSARLIDNESATAFEQFETLKNLARQRKNLILKDGRGYNYLVNIYNVRETYNHKLYKWTRIQFEWVEVGEANA